MGFPSNLLGGGTDNGEGDDRPPKPEPEDKSRTVERTRYEATVEYRNGDTETFDCYGIYSRSENYIQFNITPYGTNSYDGSETYSYHRKKIHYETLDREPVLEEVTTDTFVLEWMENYEWKRPRLSSFADKSWQPKATDIELTVKPGVE